MQQGKGVTFFLARASFFPPSQTLISAGGSGNRRTGTALVMTGVHMIKAPQDGSP
jgi:hypothetical protein